MTGYAQWRAAVAAALAPAQIESTEEGWLRRAYIRGETPRQAVATISTLIYNRRVSAKRLAERQRRNRSHRLKGVKPRFPV